MARVAFVAACLALAWLSLPTWSARATGRLRVAITIDDLPGVLPPGSHATRLEIIQGLIAALRAHNVQHATGFVIGEGMEPDSDRSAAVDAWINAGYEIGSHTYRHLSFSAVDVETYLRDSDANRPLIAALEARTGQRQHYFRCPYLEEGATDAARRALRRDLNAHQTMLARVSIDFDDWAFSVPYERCRATQDAAKIALFQKAYVESGVAQLHWAEVASRVLFRRAMPHVLLLHANPVTAATLDDLLNAYDARGVQYISLAEALRDPIYRGFYNTSGASVIVQAAQQRHVAHAPTPTLPLFLLDLACR